MQPNTTSAIILLGGLALILVGVTFKLNHLMGADPIFNAGALGLVLGLLLWMRDLFRKRRGQK
tara:strand:+ start:118 stop:306 length:189 start_codon:yes stop_codon:yes gene_type:complete